MRVSGNNKKIFFSYIKPPFFSGQSTATELIIQYLEERGWECQLLPIYPLQRSIDNPIKRWYRLFANQLKLIPRLSKVVGTRRPVIHISLGQSWMSFVRIGIWFFPLLLLKPKTTLILSLHGSTFMNWGNSEPITKFFLLFLRRAELVSILGKKQKEKLSTLGISKTKIIFNTSELNAVNVEYVLNKHQEKTINVLHLSLLVESKGFPEYLEAIHLLAQKRLSYKINAIICGPLAFTEYCHRFKSSKEKKQWVEDKIRAIQSLENKNLTIQWIPGAKGEEKEKLFRDAHIFVMPTSFPVEAQPLVLLEALSSGSTIISTRVGEIESVLDDKSAILIDDKLPETIFSNIEVLATDPQKRIKLSLAGLDRINGPLSLRHYIDTWESIFEKFTGL